MLRSATTGALVALLLLVGAGCSGENEATSESARDPLPEDWLAESMLLTVLDFPVGWSDDPGTDDDEANPGGACLRGNDRPTGAASSPSFSSTGAAEVEHVVLVFETESEAGFAVDEFRKRLECFANVMNDGKFDNDEATYRDARVGGVSFPPIGEHSLALRISTAAKARDKDQVPNQASLFLDTVLVQRGRFVSIVLVTDVFSPFDPDALLDLAQRADGKMQERAE